MTKNLYMITSDNCLFFVCSDLSAEEIEQAYLTELNGKFYPKNYYKVTVTDLETVNHIRYKSQPIYSVKKKIMIFHYIVDYILYLISVVDIALLLRMIYCKASA